MVTPDSLTCNEDEHFVLFVEDTNEMENVGVIKTFQHGNLWFDVCVYVWCMCVVCMMCIVGCVWYVYGVCVWCVHVVCVHANITSVQCITYCTCDAINVGRMSDRVWCVHRVT